MKRTLLCVAHGRDDEWEAICVDLDIAVAGTSYEAVRQSLDQAIRSYIEDAMAETPEVSRRLLSRRAPWHVRAALGVRLALSSIFGGRDDDGQFEAHRLPCPA